MTIPGALNVQIDIPEFDFATPMGASLLKIWGISLGDISQAADFNGRTINVYVGMQKGLPLAKPQQAGLILSGSIFQAFGNWEGVNMTLDFVIQVNYGGNSPKNLILNVKNGQSLTDAITQTLNSAYSGFKVTINTSNTLTANQDFVGQYSNLVTFAETIQMLSTSIITTPNYQGLKLVVRPNEFVIFDGTTITNPTQIAFEDLIGQPTWINFATVQFKVVMRADLRVSDYIQLPAGQVTLGAKSYPNLKNNPTFTTASKPFQIIRIRHVGDYRNPDPAAWVSIIDCIMT